MFRVELFVKAKISPKMHINSRKDQSIVIGLCSEKLFHEHTGCIAL
jgi:hypothetical protein